MMNYLVMLLLLVVVVVMVSAKKKYIFILQTVGAPTDIKIMVIDVVVV